MSVTPVPPRRYRAGDTVEDICRACKADRLHSVIVADPDGRPIRVQCDFCGSQHNFRGGPEETRSAAPRAAVARSSPGARTAERPAFPIVTERERAREPVMVDAGAGAPVDLEMLLRRIIREETGLTAVVPSDRWRNGTLVLRPENAALQEKTWPIETFFHKIVMIRNRLRTLEQQINAATIPEDLKVKLQGYVTGCYGSLTSFNVLFAEEADQFKGTGSD